MVKIASGFHIVTNQREWPRLFPNPTIGVKMSLKRTAKRHIFAPAFQLCDPRTFPLIWPCTAAAADVPMETNDDQHLARFKGCGREDPEAAPSGTGLPLWSRRGWCADHFALMLMGLMVVMGGVALDFMRFEATRTTLQNTLTA